MAGDNKRIVNVGSGGHTWGKLNLDDIMHEKTSVVVPPFPWSAILSGFYCNSKLANNLFNLQLAKRLQGTGVHTYCLCPGFVETDIGKGNKEGITKYIYQGMRYFAKSPQQGASTPIHCALSRDVANHSGEMYKNCEYWDPRRRPRLSEKDATKLWDLSEKLVGLKA